MAEFCYPCFKKIFNVNLPPEDVIMSHDLDFCEECLEMKHLVVVVRKAGVLRKFLFKNGFYNTDHYK